MEVSQWQESVGPVTETGPFLRSSLKNGPFEWHTTGVETPPSSSFRAPNPVRLGGINETWRYQPNGQPLGIWNSVGRLDVGTESIIVRGLRLLSRHLALSKKSLLSK